MVSRKSLTVYMLALLLMLILSMVSTSAVTLHKPVIVYDPVSFGGFADLQEVVFNDNGSHLIIYLQTNGTIPRLFSSSYYVGLRQVILLDTDDNIVTGYQPWEAWSTWYFYKYFPIGAEARIEAHDYYANMVIYNPDGTTRSTITVNYMLNDSGYYVFIPLSELNLTVGDTVRALFFVYTIYLSDWLRDIVNFTVPYANITVDGDAHDWNLTASLALIDGNDGLTINYPGANVTAVYVATDNKYLFMLFNISSFNYSYYTSNPSDGTMVWPSISMYVDVDNDGVNDYFIFLNQYSLRVYNTTNWVSQRYWNGSSDYTSIWAEKHVEAMINLSIFGLNSLSGSNISLNDPQLTITIYDGLEPRNTMEYGVIYSIGSGGYYLSSNISYSGSLIGSKNIVLGELNLTISSNSSIVLKIIGLNRNPIITSNPLYCFSKYYKLIVNNASAVEWPIRASITYNELLLASRGINETDLRVYYYNASIGEYVAIPLTRTVIDKTNNIVYFNITDDIYRASGGDPIIMLGAPLPIGGKLVLYSENNSADTRTRGYGYTLLYIWLVAIGLCAVVFAYSKRKQ